MSFISVYIFSEFGFALTVLLQAVIFFAFFILCNIDVAFVSSVRHYWWWSQWAECCSLECESHISPDEIIPLFSHSLVLLFLSIKCLLSFMVKLHDIYLIPLKFFFYIIQYFVVIQYIVLYIQNVKRINHTGMECTMFTLKEHGMYFKNYIRSITISFLKLSSMDNALSSVA